MQQKNEIKSVLREHCPVVWQRAERELQTPITVNDDKPVNKSKIINKYVFWYLFAISCYWATISALALLLLSAMPED